MTPMNSTQIESLLPVGSKNGMILPIEFKLLSVALQLLAYRNGVLIRSGHNRPHLLAICLCLLFYTGCSTGMC